MDFQIESNLSDLNLETEYLTGSNDPVSNFFRPCLQGANRYDRAVGYFRSTVFLLIGQDLIDFAIKGGKVRLICSPQLEDNDIETLMRSKKQSEEIISNILLEEFAELFKYDKTKYRAKVLATLIACGTLEIRLAIRGNHIGIYHEKLGAFYDTKNNAVSFLGSSNESLSAWSKNGNYERIEAFCSWNEGREADRCNRHVNYFTELWDNKIEGIQIRVLPDDVSAFAKSEGWQSPEHIERNLLDAEEPYRMGNNKKRLYPHQENALEKWQQQDCKGILEHATGSGKTFTAIHAIKDHNGPTLVLVPSILLLKQWVKEITKEIPDAIILTAGGGDIRWKNSDRLRGFTSPEPTTFPRIVISTIQTASASKFVNNLNGGLDLLIVADEVHNLGSPHYSNCLAIKAGPRLGLSATPQRYGDLEGTKNIFEYFGPVINPPYTLYNAIDDGRLTKYKYYPDAIFLTQDESDEWSKISKRILFEYAKSSSDESGTKIMSEKLKLLLIQRSRIAKKASNKTTYALKVIKNNYRDGHRWLVYCEDQDQMDNVYNLLTSSGYEPFRYHSDMPDIEKAEVLNWFESNGGIVVSIRCLDEGVDIPVTSHALILASSQNPRQFIQRRGRVLRKYEGKDYAYIYDALVTPENIESDSQQLSLLRAELVRANEFALYSSNKSASMHIREMLLTLGIDISDFINIGIEEDVTDG